MTDHPAWLHEATRFPVAFAQVREDPELDRRVIELCGDRVRVLMVASGGCTAAALAAWGGVSELHLVDPNPAQMALSRLKLALVAASSPGDRLRLLGHEPLPPAERRLALEDWLGKLSLPADSLGRAEDVARLGPDQAGRYERLFAALRQALTDQRDAIEDLLRLDDAQEQARRAASSTRLGAALDSAFTTVFALPNLVALFGEEATQNPLEPFAAHFATRLRRVLARRPAAGNPFLSQLLLGRFVPPAAHAWLLAPSPGTMPALRFTVATMDQALERHPGGYDYVHLSNILDWLSPAAAKRALHLAWQALAPGGRVLIRQLNSSLDIRALGPAFQWDAGTAERFRDEDRSFFYRSLHLGEKT